MTSTIELRNIFSEFHEVLAIVVVWKFIRFCLVLFSSETKTL